MNRRIPFHAILFLISATSAGVTALTAGPAGPVDQDARRIARPVDHRPLGVGRRVPEFSWTDLDQQTGNLEDLLDGELLVIAVRDAECPLARKIAPRLAALEDAYAADDVRFAYLNLSGTNDAAAMERDRSVHGFVGPYLVDPELRIGSLLQARSTTEVFLIDASRTLVYRGAVNDQYGIGFARAEPRRRFLSEAIEASLDGLMVEQPATSAPGCLIEVEPPDSREGAPTWHGEISRIMQQNCQRCHRQGGIGPFALETLDQVRARRKMVSFVIDESIMPPWFADPHNSAAFQNDTSLLDADRQLLLDWIEAGCEEGDQSQAPLARDWIDGWQIGDPDAVVPVPDAIDVPAEGTVEYLYQYVRTGFPEDRWVSAMEVRADPRVIHHVLVFLEEPRQPGESPRDIRRRWQGGLRGYFACLVPGQATTIYPEGMAKLLPKNAWLKFQMHYTPNGEAVRDRPEIGFRFWEGQTAEPEVPMYTSAAASLRFLIPPGAEHHEVVATRRFDEPITLFSFAPHMHLRGSAFRYELLLPDGSVQTLLDVPHYDFNWQLRYKLRDPLSVPAGAELRATGWFDNSAANPANPDPSRAVPFGEQTWDEMMIGYFEWHRTR